ncbi:SDR family NAD(P)-dependent oxidoreductase [Mangrovimicrobium sediminis]|uniref:SDR family NAD(P)-dependent oxidoreductase n=1 Tax=Mangrovimicrobium sediminis TaxID=2562682 RepID=A0A4Z0LW40_9GAMM|nr:SDR family NAD(P)-dependent oxidoreductase [Haliea sp. SAOS-164]TGD71366.1 SDR family NAD(P)-dependent oxidoreductase [Haliea sp. SAOS-164]
MTDISFAGRVAIVTGAGGGLGRTYALDIARRGGAVVVNDLGGSVEGPGAGRSMADAVVEEITAAGGRAVASYDSVASRAGAQAIVDTALETFGRVDAVINNAGNMRVKAFEEYSEEDFDAILRVHLGGSFNVTQAAWAHFKARGYGRVVFTSSSTGMYGSELYACYAAAKAGITGLMNVLSLEGAPHGITCNAVMPNAISRMTDMVSAELAERMGETAMAEAAERMAVIGDAMSPAFNTGLAVYLASEACTSTHAVYSACVGRIARVFIGATEGWHGALDAPASAEDIATHFEQICDLSGGVHIPQGPGDEFQIVLARPQPAVKPAK